MGILGADSFTRKAIRRSIAVFQKKGQRSNNPYISGRSKAPGRMHHILAACFFNRYCSYQKSQTPFKDADRWHGARTKSIRQTDSAPLKALSLREIL